MKAPRTGGASILRNTLEKMPLDIFNYKDHPEWFESWLSQITDVDLKQYFMFTFVRNPWDRAVSIASYFQIPFHQFAGNFQQLVTRDLNLLQHSFPLFMYTCLKSRLSVDFLGRFEMLQADFDRLCEILGLPQTNLPISSESSHEPYVNCYDFCTKGQIDQIYGQDAVYFGYQFGEPAEGLGREIARRK
ncbi:MAG: chondroitin 4-O-sulfotransferase [Planctomycetaceae bacterium]|nr:chondroitin 4-O-sulfotransferase [Planctomycetaceae bacterium]